MPAPAHRVKVGLTLPSFRDDPERIFDIAAAAEAADLDAVFAYEHLFRLGPHGRRPSHDLWATLGAVAAVTRRVRVGSLVARATLRPAAVLAHSFATLQRVSDGRALAVLGAGDAESRAENEEFGVSFGSLADRVGALRAAAAATRAAGVETWIGGSHPRVLAACDQADGWNRWAGSVEAFAREAAAVLSVQPDATLTWGGLVVLDVDDDAARDKAARLGASSTAITGSPVTVAQTIAPYVEAGATWVVLAPVDSNDPANAALARDVAVYLADGVQRPS